MKTTCNKNLSAVLISVAILSACGGGGGTTTASNSDTSTTTAPTITGKAIDGYLAGATVCLDLNSNNACDAGEPTTTTDANGSYGLTYDGDPTGKKLLVVVTPTTRDSSRPGYTFPTSFTLSALADSGSGQNVTPLTTMVVSLIDSGQTESAAKQTVANLVGASVDLKADYIANGDSSTATFAGKVVDKVTQFGGSGNATGGVRAVMNAIASKGDVDTVSQTDVDSAAAMPTYDASINATDVLSQSLFSYDLTDHWWDPTPVLSAVHWIRTQSGFYNQASEFMDATLTLLPPTDTWVRERYDGMHSVLVSETDQLVLQPDGSWAPFSWKTADDLYFKGLQVQGTSGNVATVADLKTGASDTIEYRGVQLGGVSFANATAGMLDDYTRTKLSGSFTGDVPAYLGILTNAADVVSVDADTHCDDPFYGCIDSSGQTHTSVDDAIGRSIPLQSYFDAVTTSAPDTKLVLATDGTGQIIDNANSQVVYDSTKVTWSRYAKNPNILVVNVAIDSNSIYEIRSQSVLQAGGKLVVALQGGNLKLGLMLPKGTEFRFMEYSQDALNQLATAIRQALSS